MTDIFDNSILCRNCNKVMKPVLISKNGFNLRAVKCSQCGEAIVHPTDKQEYEEFMKLKNKEFEVKMRMVGNSYAVSIPREIVDFMHESEKMLNDMVRLSFDNANRLSLMFNSPENEEAEGNKRVVKAREIRIIKNNKPVLHVRQVYDSANPKNNQSHIIKAKKINQEDEEED